MHKGIIKRYFNAPFSDMVGFLMSNIKCAVDKSLNLVYDRLVEERTNIALEVGKGQREKISVKIANTYRVRNYIDCWNRHLDS